MGFVDVYSKVTLPCELNTFSDRARWSFTDENFKYHQDLYYDLTGRFRVVAVHGQRFLEVNPIQLQDSGYYRCYTESGNILQSCYVNVVGTSTIFI